jgi:hypothetical protein
MRQLTGDSGSGIDKVSWMERFGAEGEGTMMLAALLRELIQLCGGTTCKSLALFILGRLLYRWPGTPLPIIAPSGGGPVLCSAEMGSG